MSQIGIVNDSPRNSGERMLVSACASAALRVKQGSKSFSQRSATWWMSSLMNCQGCVCIAHEFPDIVCLSESISFQLNSADEQPVWINILGISMHGLLVTVNRDVNDAALDGQPAC